MLSSIRVNTEQNPNTSIWSNNLWDYAIIYISFMIRTDFLLSKKYLCQLFSQYFPSKILYLGFYLDYN